MSNSIAFRGVSGADFSKLETIATQAGVDVETKAKELFLKALAAEPLLQVGTMVRCHHDIPDLFGEIKAANKTGAEVRLTAASLERVDAYKGRGFVVHPMRVDYWQWQDLTVL